MKRNLLNQSQVDSICQGVNITNIFPKSVDDIVAFLANQTTSLINSQTYTANLGKESIKGKVN